MPGRRNTVSGSRSPLRNLGFISGVAPRARAPSGQDGTFGDFVRRRNKEIALENRPHPRVQK
jgi:hypothetical protein